MNKPSLREIQQAFASSIFGDGGAASELLETHERRFKVYRTSVLENYRQALASIFPVTSRLVGEQFFSQAATQFAHKNESTSGDLNEYGDAFPAFLEAYRPARDLEYLPDVARLEWRWHETFHASDQPALDLEKLATVRPDDYGRIIFDLQAGYRSLQTPYPVDRIWQVNQPEHADPELVHLACVDRSAREITEIVRCDAIGRGDGIGSGFRFRGAMAGRGNNHWRVYAERGTVNKYANRCTTSREFLAKSCRISAA